MVSTNQQPISSTAKIAVVRVLSNSRFGTYLNAAGHDWDRAWRLYLYNAKLGDAFHLPIQTVEVGIRNCIDLVLSKHFGPQWGTSPTFAKQLEKKQINDLDVVITRINKRRITLENTQIVAGLSFGFWVAMLHRRYGPQIWSRDLSLAFPHLPNTVDLKALSLRLGEISSLRNRISHHEPIFKMNTSHDFKNMIEAIEWICPTTCSLVKTHCRVLSVMRERP